MTTHWSWRTKNYTSIEFALYKQPPAQYQKEVSPIAARAGDAGNATKGNGLQHFSKGVTTPWNISEHFGTQKREVVIARNPIIIL